MAETEVRIEPLSAPGRRSRTLDTSVAARLRGDLDVRVLMLALSLIATVPLVLILVYIVVKGASSINWQFLTELPKPMGEAGGGISNAIVGTVILVAIATVLAQPTAAAYTPSRWETTRKFAWASPGQERSEAEW